MSQQTSTNSSPKVIVGLAANLPGPQNIAEGTFYVATDTAQAYVLVILPSSARFWLPLFNGSGASQFQNIFLNSATGLDTNTGTSPSSPWKTLTPVAALLLIVPATAVQLRITDITPGGGIFGMPVVSTGASATGNQLMKLPAWGANSEPVTFIGATPTDSGLGIRTSAGVATATRAGTTVLSTNDSGGAVYTAGALVGMRFRVTSGAALGATSKVEQNTTTTITLVNNAPAAAGFVSGDQFVIEKPSTLFQAPNASPQAEVGFTSNGPGTGGAIFYGIRFAGGVGSSDNFLWEQGTYQFRFCEMDGSVSTPPTTFSIIGSNWTANGSNNFNQPNLVNNFPVNLAPGVGDHALAAGDGLFIHGTVSLSQQGVLLQENTSSGAVVVFSDASLIQNIGDEILFATFVWHFPVLSTQNWYSMDGQTGIPPTFAGHIWGYPNGNTDCISAGMGASLVLRGFQVVSNVYGATSSDALLLQWGSRGFFSHVTSLTAAVGGVGLRTRDGSEVFVTDANGAGGTTIDGGGGAVVVGGNPVTSWANIAAGLTADVSDIGAASTQMCFVGNS